MDSIFNSVIMSSFGDHCPKRSKSEKKKRKKD